MYNKNNMIRVIFGYMKIEKDALRLTMDAGNVADKIICIRSVLRSDISI